MKSVWSSSCLGLSGRGTWTVFDRHPTCTEHFVARLQKLASQTLFYDDFVSISIILIQSNFVIGIFLKT